MVGTTRNWEDELRGWLKPFLDCLGHKSRLRMCPFYVAGLIVLCYCKSVLVNCVVSCAGPLSSLLKHLNC